MLKCWSIEEQSCFLPPVKLYIGGVDKLMFYERIQSIILIQHKKISPRNIF